MPASARAKETPIEELPLEERIRRRAYELYIGTAINLARKSMTGSRPKKRRFTLRNNREMPQKPATLTFMPA